MIIRLINWWPTNVLKVGQSIEWSAKQSVTNSSIVTANLSDNLPVHTRSLILAFQVFLLIVTVFCPFTDSISMIISMVSSLPLHLALHNLSKQKLTSVFDCLWQKWLKMRPQTCASIDCFCGAVVSDSSFDCAAFAWLITVYVCFHSWCVLEVVSWQFCNESASESRSH